MLPAQKSVFSTFLEATALAAITLVCLAHEAPAQEQAPSPGKTTAAAAKEKPTAPAKTAAAAAAEKNQTNNAKKKSGQSIVLLVGDDPITAYEIEQRQRLLVGGAGISEQAKSRFQTLIRSDAAQAKLKQIQEEAIQENKGKSRDEIIAIIKSRSQAYALTLQKQAVESARSGAAAGVRQKAIDQLIDEKLMLQEAKRLGVLATDEDVDKYIEGKASRGKVTKEQFYSQFKSAGIDVESMRQLYKAQLSWADAVRKRYGYEIRVTDRDVDRVVATRPKDSEDDVELHLQRVTLPLPAKMDQKATAQRYVEAETLRSGFTGCAGLAAQAAAITGAKHENLGSKRPSAIPEPTRGLLLAAQNGDLLPPALGGSGIEIWAVCGRDVVKADEKQRTEVAGELRQQQFGLYADRFLKDLRKDTPIEYR
jgi:peptidyl-prolyl cis-trans isomerase SurA